jgi:hypothetical protein
MKDLDLSFLQVPANGSTYDDDGEVGKELADKCKKAAQLVKMALGEMPGAAENLDEYEADYSLSSYVDDMVDLAIALDKAKINVIWPGGVRPTYD